MTILADVCNIKDSITWTHQVMRFFMQIDLDRRVWEYKNHNKSFLILSILRLKYLGLYYTTKFINSVTIIFGINTKIDFKYKIISQEKLVNLNIKCFLWIPEIKINVHSLEVI